MASDEAIAAIAAAQQSQEDDEPLAWVMHTVKIKDDNDKNKPYPRSGQTLTVIGSNAYMFGGMGMTFSPNTEEPTGAAALDDLFELKLSGAKMEWMRVVVAAQDSPMPRWGHTTCLFDNTQLLVFGGHHSAEHRLNDVWMFDVIKWGWSQPNSDHCREAMEANALSHSKWPNVPSPRGHHSATMIGDKMYVFGGYGGFGYSRRELDDLYVLNTMNWTWAKVSTKGSPPEKRSGHQGLAVEKSILIFGGWNSTTQFSDMHIIETNMESGELPTWSRVETGMEKPAWNMAACSVVAIPTWKVFLFGGMMGPLSDSEREGKRSDATRILDTVSYRFTEPKLEGRGPCGRSSTVLSYDAKNSRLLVFGGWSDQWHDDFFTLDVGSIVGPPYAITSIYPNFGPITGNTNIEIGGIDFINTEDVVIKFGNRRQYVDVRGTFVTQSKLVCETPDFTKFPPGTYDVRVGLDGDSFTTTSQKYTFFSITNAANSIMFGPGLISGCAPNEDVTFLIQARDNDNLLRTTGGDEYLVQIVLLGGGEDGDDLRITGINIEDLEDGRYVVTYVAKFPGEYKIDVTYMGTFGGEVGPVRGSGVTIKFDEFAPRDNNNPTGPLVQQTLKDDVAKVVDFCEEVGERIFVKIKDDGWTAEDQIRVLMSVKEMLLTVEARSTEISFTVDLCSCVLTYLQEQAVELEGISTALTSGKTAWAKILRDAPNILSRVSPMMRQHSSKIRADIAAYESHVEEYKTEVLGGDFWTYATGTLIAMGSLSDADARHLEELDTLSKMSHVANVFECQEEIKKSLELMDEQGACLKNFRALWEQKARVDKVVSLSKEIMWAELEPDSFEEGAKALVQGVRKLPKVIKTSDAFKGMDKAVKEYLTTCPLIVSLRSPAMRERHWRELMDVVQKEFVMPHKDPDLKLSQLLDLQLHEHLNDVEEITEKASKEAKHEETLNQLEITWAAVDFSMSWYKDTDVPLLRMEDEAVEQLESDQMAVQSIVSSRYPFFRVPAVEWQKALGLVSDLTQLLSEIQRTWSYLEPLFIGSEEVKKELPDDARRFLDIDSAVKTILQRAYKAKNVKLICMQPGLPEKLESLEKKQDQCKKALSEFLDGKRRQFPRFYFMSEADLLDLLSNSSQPLKVLVHLDKILLATKEAKLQTLKNGQGHAALSWVAGVGKEEVAFDTAVPLLGKAESYLLALLHAQNYALSRLLSSSVGRYPQEPRAEWIMKKKPDGTTEDPAQVIILVAGMDYTQGVERAMRIYGDGDANAIMKYYENMKNMLSDLITLTQTSLDKGDRQRVMCMITLDAHSRDIMDNLIKEEAFKPTDFQWQSMLRPKYLQETRPSARTASIARFSICDAKFDYGFEYLGNGPRLVITPLTDRIYVTATQALHLKMGCAPAGPAGTGKTESTKDLASALGKCCYVFNCSPEMDYQSMGNIFKGLAASGSWGCFDEFNRLIPEVLSVCSVQFKAVCDGLKSFDESLTDTHRVTIEGDTVSLDNTCGAFITMNPGYLGRSELPEGLKALFRPITVIVPDLVLICENMLMAEGFLTAQALASKFYGLYTLLSELLSKQLHYDWGLRAVKSVLVVAGVLRRAEPDLAEDALLMRALRDFNIPKIVQSDEVVFFGLLGDLFPGLDPPRVFDEELSQCVTQACEEVGLWPDNFFTLKVMQLDELLDIRHCVFVMGPPGAGKSTTWQMLAAARNIRRPENKVKTVDINPKTMPTEDLYGHISLATREWKDGLLSSIMRDLARIPDENPKWMILDGDLDANWIESMNSVMDDNKMLTLASNERIPLKPYMRMIFEIRDLRFATPATVSRAGILYISMDGGSQWKSIAGSWVRGCSDDLMEDPDRERTHALFEKYIPPALKFFATSLQTIVPMNDVSLITSVLRLLETALTRPIVVDDVALETTFVFCVVWGLGSSLSVADDGTDYRATFSNWFRATFKTVKIPSRDTVFDYWLDPATTKFESWKDSPSFRETKFDSTVMVMEQCTVPTAESASISFWLEKLVKSGRHVMLAGPAGTGKTQIMNGMLGALTPASHIHLTVNMNFYSSGAVIQAALESPLQKRTGSLFGPPGAAKLVYFVDDLNLPEVDKYGTQSAIALIRQHIDYGHWYDISKLAVKNVDDCQYVSCLNPTAGSFTVDGRLQRHFTAIAVGMPTATSLLTIYEAFLDGHLDSQGFSTLVSAVSATIIKSALQVHKDVTEAFRKTAANFHYEFSIRHLANVFAGLLVATPHQFNQPEKFVFLWLHESERVYGDRLVSDADTAKFNEIMLNNAKKNFGQYNVSQFYMTGGDVKNDPLMFCHFADGNTNADELVYDQAFDLKQLTKALVSALEDYNETNAAMNLTLFDDAVYHVARIVRIVKQVGGHALLVGVGGSGKQSLARLAAFVCGYTVMKIMVNAYYTLLDFKGDLQAMCQRAAVKGEGVLFLLADTQITNERFLISINDLLSSGNVPDLYNKDERDGIIASITSKAKSAGFSAEPESVWQYYLSRIRENLHVCLCFSPVGPGLRSRARKFPALVNCTVIDWFQPWPTAALRSVGQAGLAEIELGEPEVRMAIENFMPGAFDVVNRMCGRFQEHEGRFVYTTPKTYLEMLHLYKTMLTKKREEQDQKIFRLASGIEKLTRASDDVEMLEANLKIMLASAQEKAEVAQSIAAKAQKEKSIVDIENEKAVKEQAQVAEIQIAVQSKAEDTANDLAKAEPALHAAMAALDSLDKKDLGQCKTMNKPPPGVDDIFGAVMVLLAGVNPNIIVQKSGRVRDKERTWEHSKKALLGNVNGFLEELKGFKTLIDEGSVPKVNWQEVRPFLELEHFLPEAIEKRNSAAGGLCGWVINIVSYYDIVLVVEPKRIALKAANEELAGANERLAIVQAKCAELQAKLDDLTEQFNKAEEQRREAQEVADKGRMKLELANRLIMALGSEQVRWSAGVEKFTVERELLVGDCLLASAFVSYVGPFDKSYRGKVMAELTPMIITPELGSPIPATFQSKPIDIMSSEAEIARYQTEGLPADAVSSENGSIVLNSMRYPLMVDPQEQALFWIKRRFGSDLKVGRLGQSKLANRIMDALENGDPFLIENMGEAVDQSLMPVIGRQSTKRGTKRFMQLGELEVEIDNRFTLFLHTKLNNPHYPPEVQAECTLVNFMVTQQGLEDQLLSKVVQHERADLASQRAALIMQQNLFTIRVKQLEDGILHRLAEAQGDITEDRELIEELELSKKISDDIAIKLVDSKKTSEKIYETSELYRPVARRGALLFFVMNALYKMHTYYMYSLNSFVSFFLRGITLVDHPELANSEMVAEAEVEALTEDLDLLEEQISKRIEEIEERDRQNEGLDLGTRLNALKSSVSLVVYDYVRTGLFERDKLTVATLVCLRVMVDEGLLSKVYVDVMTRARLADEAGNMGHDLTRWLSESSWARLKAMEEDLGTVDPRFEGIAEKVALDADDFEEWYNKPDPENAKLPGDYEQMDDFPRLLLLRVFRPDRLPMALNAYIKANLGEDFVFQQPFSMGKTFVYTSASTPVVFVLYPGVDPTSWVEEYGLTRGISTDNGNFANISMGQGQEKRADDVILKFASAGGWVFLQNVHLMQTWLPTLEEKLETLTPHQDFRVFISAEPPALSYLRNLPEGLAKAAFCVSNEPPSDLRANMSRAWTTFSQGRIDSSSKSDTFKGCLFGLSFFHSVMLGRRRFGSQGWSRAYGFNMGDLKICSDVLQSYLERSKEVPWQDLRYIFGEIMYGGHITDFFDRRTNNTYLKVIFEPKLVSGLELAPKLVAPDPAHHVYDEYTSLIAKDLPAENPLIYGLHPNAEIGFLSTRAEEVFQSIMYLEMGSSGGGAGAGGGAGTIIRDTLKDLLDRLPAQFNMVQLADRSESQLTQGDGPFVVVVLQECGRLNALLTLISSTLEELLKGLNGQLNMSQAMEELSEALLINQVPGRNPFHVTSWEKLAWASKKGLSSWFGDLLLRHVQMSDWSLSLTLPYSVWLPGLINPTALLTAVKQVTARKNSLPLDNMSLDTFVTRMLKESDAKSNKQYPEDGIFVHGLLMEGARWTDEEESGDDVYTVGTEPPTPCAGYLIESRPKQLLTPMPLIYVRAVQVQSNWLPRAVGYLRNDPELFECPVYTTTARGHTFVFLATLKTVDPTHRWVLAGVALFLQSDD
jgi:dynein heavy chain